MLQQSNYQISYDELRTAFYSVLARVCHKPYIKSDFTLGDLGITSELVFCAELELALKKCLNRFWRNGFDFRQWFYTWNDKTPVREMLDKLAWQYDVAVPKTDDAFDRFRATRVMIDNAMVAQHIKKRG